MQNELSIKDIYGTSWEVLKQHIWIFLSLSIILFLCEVLLYIPVNEKLIEQSIESTIDMFLYGRSDNLILLVNQSSIIMTFMFIILTVISIFIYAVNAKLIYDKFITAHMHIKSAIFFVRKLFLRLLFYHIILFIFFCLILFIFSIPILIMFFFLDDISISFALIYGLLLFVLSFWAFIRFSLSPLVFLFEKQKIIYSLKQSYDITKGYFWKILIISVIYILMVTFSFMLLSIINAFIDFIYMTWFEDFVTIFLSLSLGSLISINIYMRLSGVYKTLRIKDKADSVIDV